MDAKRAQDILKHITKDKDYGFTMIEKMTIGEVVDIVNILLPNCLKEAEKSNNANDVGFFNSMIDRYRAVAVKKIMAKDRFWIAYSDLTGYPYMIDHDEIVLYDFKKADEIVDRLNKAGYGVTFGEVDSRTFKMELGHMYRNGYKRVRFMDGVHEPLIVEKEEVYPYEDFYGEDTILNPGLEASMIDFFQEFRKKASLANREQILKKREDVMLDMIKNAEYMVPCIKTETEEEVEIQHPYIDLTGKISPSEGEDKVIAIPAFTDGYELNKCYEGHHEDMLYKYDELVSLVDELGASGIIINALGISYYLRKDLFAKIK